MKKIENQAQLVAAIGALLEYNWRDEEADYLNWKRENPGMEDTDHIFNTMLALDNWIGEA